MKQFQYLSKKEKDALRDARSNGSGVEVHCPWWPLAHWEDKTTGDFIYNCYYRAKTKKRLG